MTIDIRRSTYDEKCWFAACHDEDGRTTWVGTENGKAHVMNEIRYDFDELIPKIVWHK